MDDFTPEQLLAALGEEQLYLEECLKTETNMSERQSIEKQITEISEYFASQGVSRQTPRFEKDQTQLRHEIQKLEKRFLSLYNGFKSEVKCVRHNMEKKCSEIEPEEQILTLHGSFNLSEYAYRFTLLQFGHRRQADTETCERWRKEKQSFLKMCPNS